MLEMEVRGIFHSGQNQDALPAPVLHLDKGPPSPPPLLRL